MKPIAFILLIAFQVANCYGFGQTITPSNHAETDFPKAKQLYPRKTDNRGHPKIAGTFYNSPGVEATSICLRVYTTNENDDAFSRVLIHEECTDPISPSNSSTIAFEFEPAIDAVLVDYRFELAADLVGVGMETYRTASLVVAGDVYVITGQSNAVAEAGGPSERDPGSPGNHWARSFGGFTGNQASYPPPVHEIWDFSSGFGHPHDVANILNYPWAQSGTIGLYLQKFISTDHGVPICVLNGAVGGTSVLQHTPSAMPMTPADVQLQHNTTNFIYEGVATGKSGTFNLYDRLYHKAYLAGVLEDVKAIVWIQGPDDACCNGTITLNPDAYPHTYYPKVFDHVYRAWHLDFPNLQKVYVFQESIFTAMRNEPNWGSAFCKPNLAASLREIHRSFGTIYPDVTVLSQMGIGVPDRHKIDTYACTWDGVHYKESGYKKMAERLYKVIDRDFYCNTSFVSAPVTPPNLRRAYRESGKIVLEFDQDVFWQSHFSFSYDLIDSDCNITTHSQGWDLDRSFYDGCGNRLTISSWEVDGNLVKLDAVSSPNKISYLAKEHYPGPGFTKSYEGPWLWNLAQDNGALSFYNVPIAASESVSEPEAGGLTHAETRLENIPAGCENDDFAPGFVCGDIVDATLITAPVIYNCFDCPGASTLISNGRAVIFRAGNRIKLRPGFKVEKGGSLHGFISMEHCTASAVPCKTDGNSEGKPVSDQISSENFLYDDFNFQLYPNPSTGQLKVAYLDANGDNAQFRLIDSFGRILISQGLNEGETEIILNGIGSGMYWASIRAGGKVVVKKLVLNR